MLPPTPVSVLLIDSYRLPLAAPDAVPTCTDTEPDVSSVAAPLCSVTWPDALAAPLSAVPIAISPLLAAELVPDRIVTDPPLP